MKASEREQVGNLVLIPGYGVGHLDVVGDVGLTSARGAVHAGVALLYNKEDIYINELETKVVLPGRAYIYGTASVRHPSLALLLYPSEITIVIYSYLSKAGV